MGTIAGISAAFVTLDLALDGDDKDARHPPFGVPGIPCVARSSWEAQGLGGDEIVAPTFPAAASFSAAARKLVSWLNRCIHGSNATRIDKGKGDGREEQVNYPLASLR